jgi:hypothetical protein
MYKDYNMKRIFLIHWNAIEAAERIAYLHKAGFDVDFEPISPAVIKKLRAKRPDAFVIDLSRLPSQGRDIALNFRHAKATRPIPIIFIEGVPEKVAGIKKFLPDAVYADWRNIKTAINRAISNPPEDPAPVKSVFDAYTDTPLRKKLGIKDGIKILLINSPSGFTQKLGELPGKAKIIKKSSVPAELVIWFLKSRRDLEKIADISQNVADDGGLWIAWPKKGCAIKSDLNQEAVRHAGLSNKLVDYKICSIDETWSALKFAWRKKK